jgi:hypothetical protein
MLGVNKVLLTKLMLLAPSAICRTAARSLRNDEQAWLLTQPQPVRRSYLREVIEAADAVPELSESKLREIWMLRQPDHVRHSYVREVLFKDTTEGHTPAD